jgi:hypothetical protein
VCACVYHTTRRGYNTEIGSAYYMLFGDDNQAGNDIPDLNAEFIPDMNAPEIPLSQNAPVFEEN